MPTYDYVCQACDHAFELVQSMREGVKRTCPACRKRKLKRLIGTGTAIFIGGGGGAEPSPDHNAKPASPAKPEAKTESTPTNDAPPEKKISGGTSTPTHEAREGRGVGNLKDAAKRTLNEQKLRASTSDTKNTRTTKKKSASTKSSTKTAAKANKRRKKE
jgi:putative FmdB family regulatory protein